jgi:hypothetical protein
MEKGPKAIPITMRNRSMVEKSAVAKQAKPDYPDIDGDGNTSESMKQAARDKKAGAAKAGYGMMESAAKKHKASVAKGYKSDAQRKAVHASKADAAAKNYKKGYYGK